MHLFSCKMGALAMPGADAHPGLYSRWQGVVLLGA